jgi:hypothetical protein
MATGKIGPKSPKTDFFNTIGRESPFIMGGGSEAQDSPQQQKFHYL